MHARAKLGIGYLPQDASVFRRLSVADNIMAVLELRGGLDAQQRDTELENLLDEMKIAHLAQQKGIRLSGSERRRVEIDRQSVVSVKSVSVCVDLGCRLLMHNKKHKSEITLQQ